MNSDNLSTISMWTGPRGSLKTLGMTADMSRRLIRSWLLKTAGLEYEQIYSNYPVGFKYYPGHGFPGIYLEPKPLNMEALYVFDKELMSCRIYIDEIDQWLDRQEWMTTTQQILAKAVQLIRKRKMSIAGSIQAFEWLNSKFQFQTDIIIKCREAAFTPWGRSRHLGLGEVSFNEWRDKSGVMTGYSFDESGKSISVTMQGKRFWNTYDTRFEFDPIETSTRYSLKRPEKEIVMPGAEGGGGEGSGAPHTPYIRDKNYQSEQKKRIDVLVAHAVDDFRSKEKFTVAPGELFDYVRGLAGGDVDLGAIGMALSKMGVNRQGRHNPKYNLYPDEEKPQGVDLGTKDTEARGDALERLYDPTRHQGVRELAGVPS